VVITGDHLGRCGLRFKKMSPGRARENFLKKSKKWAENPIFDKSMQRIPRKIMHKG
jgi:hypothetical protein